MIMVSQLIVTDKLLFQIIGFENKKSMKTLLFLTKNSLFNLNHLTITKTHLEVIFFKHYILLRGQLELSVTDSEEFNLI